MTTKQLINLLFGGMLMFLMVVVPVTVAAEDDLSDDAAATINEEVTAEDIGEDETEINEVEEEEVSVIQMDGMLIEIGNTTADETTIIVRTEEDGITVDNTVVINSNTKIFKDDGTISDLSDWIAGDPLHFTLKKYENSDDLVAISIRNKAFKKIHKGLNGWVKAIRTDAQEVDIEWAGKLYTIDVSEARYAPGFIKGIEDLKIGDRVRGRTVADDDDNPLTRDAKILVVLRRGDELFMRVTRWVVPAKLISLPQDVTRPTTIEVEILDSKFYQKGDVNNLVGAPGEVLLVDIDVDTKLRRRFLGKAFLREFAEGDKLNIVGRLNEETGNLDAKVIKDNSIQALNVANHLSKITGIDTTNKKLTVETINKNKEKVEWTVNTFPETKVYKFGEVIEFGNLEVGNVIRVRGVANRQTKNIDARQIGVVTRRTLHKGVLRMVDFDKVDGELHLKEEARTRVENALGEKYEALKERVKNMVNDR